MISFEIPKSAQAILRKIAEHEGKSEDQIAFEALMERVEDWYDAQIITERMADGSAEFVSLEDVERELAARERPAAE